VVTVHRGAQLAVMSSEEREARVVRTAEAALAERGYVAPLDVLIVWAGWHRLGSASGARGGLGARR